MQGYVSRGIMRWRLSVVRPCDMFWMGVTSNFALDMSTMIANDRHVWMISEEGTCFEHCRCAPPALLQDCARLARRYTFNRMSPTPAPP